VFLYSLFARSLEKVSKTIIWRAVTPLFSILISQVVLWLTLFPVSDWLKLTFNIASKEKLLFLLALFPIMAIAGFRKRREVSPAMLPSITWLVPAWFHLYFFCWLFIGGFSAENKWMTFWCVANLLTGITIHWWLHLRKPKLISEL
jgi:hypothetical protein